MDTGEARRFISDAEGVGGEIADVDVEAAADQVRSGLTDSMVAPACSDIARLLNESVEALAASVGAVAVSSSSAVDSYEKTDSAVGAGVRGAGDGSI
ncbi:hypothetical protein [Rhodococcus sp. ARC_M6]|uniref:hypothetical protein n=1 Tax=Rhodococcus sp. ARC_M6 TaxID=2928852 RepID=UPI001FB3605D|nr:hypothetical protein [Rhodococcus sp. ARC_M6]MCJ0906386.1 hypothetical protein [Rhodococcus sp. ARC_M6]